jgi:hypothetical protein
MCLDRGDVNLQRVDDATRPDDAGLRIDLNWGGAAVTLESACNPVRLPDRFPRDR